MARRGVSQSTTFTVTYNELLTIPVLFSFLFFPFFLLLLLPFLSFFLVSPFGSTNAHTRTHLQKTHQDAVISTVDGIITQIMICVSMFRVHRRCRNLSQGSNYQPSSIIPATVLACCHFQWPLLFSFISSKTKNTHTHLHI